MTAIVIGLGSMGRRRIRLIRSLDNDIKVAGIDTDVNKRQRAEEEFGIETFESIDSAYLQGVNAQMAFVSTSPLSHSKIISECLKRGLHTFTEINLVDEGYEENVKLAKDSNLILYLSSTFLHRKEIEYIKQAALESRSLKSYMYHVGQYLPDWHPWENYRDFFVGDRRTNGCRELMAIEFPWIFDVFGFPVSYSVQKMKNSSLDIDYPDTYQIMFEHKGGSTGVIQIDVVSRKPVRNFECISEDLYISWNGTPDGLQRFDPDNKKEDRIALYDKVDKLEGYSASIIEDAYLSEIKEFIDVIGGSSSPRYSFERDKKILAIIDDIEDIAK